MPTYDYLCEGCGHRFELFQKGDEKLKRTCSECGEKKLKRLIGAGGGIIFKGSGFYQTDYRSSEYKKRQKEESGTASKESPKKEKSDGDNSSKSKSKDGSSS